MKILDVRGHACPMPILKTKKALKDQAPGETLQVISDDYGFKNDIGAWCEKTKNKLQSLVVEGDDIIATIVKC